MVIKLIQVLFLSSPVIAYLNDQTQRYSKGKEKAFELLKSIADWVEKTRNKFKDRKGQFMQETWNDLKAKRCALNNILVNLN